jgi:hypothetical protein
MTDYILPEVIKAKFKEISTASIATALYKRGLRNQFIQGVKPVSRKSANMVGRRCNLNSNTCAGKSTSGVGQIFRSLRASGRRASLVQRLVHP